MIEYILFVVGIVLLLKGADWLVEGSSSLAKKLRVPTLIIGLTVVAFGTSMPELVVNLIAAIKGEGAIAFGNIIGSNIANLLLILGITAIITQVKVNHSTTWREIPFSLLAAVVLFIFATNAIPASGRFGAEYISRIEGIVLLGLFGVFLYYVLKKSRQSRANLIDTKIEIERLSKKKIFFYIAFGMIALYFGGQWTVNGAVALARLMGMSEYFISLTIIAIGTSLPELITSIMAAIKKDVDLAVGNVIGSNIFNILWVLGATSIIRPIAVPGLAIIDLYVLLGATCLLFMFMFIGKKHELDRWQGIIFVLLYALYILYVIFRG